MSETEVDLFVIGAGSGGVRAARLAAARGLRVVVAEESRVGGTCVIRGCVPKKLLSYAAHFQEDFEDAAGFGWTVGAAEFSWPNLIAAKDREIDRLNGVYKRLLSDAGARLIETRAELLDSARVQAGDEIFRCEKILIATGARPFVPDFPGREHVITSDEAFHLDGLPPRVLVVGGGYIACEFASIFNGLGADVVQAYRGDAVLRGFDADVRACLTNELQQKGIDLRLHTQIQAVEQDADNLRVLLFDGDSIDVDAVMYATGRHPNTAGLGCEAAGVETDELGAIMVDAYSRTNVDGIFAVGDVTNRVNLTPVALGEAQAFVQTEYEGIDTPSDHAFVPSAVFSHPPVGSVGYTEQEARERFESVGVYRSNFRPMKHTLSGREEQMLVKMLVDDTTDRVVGLHVVGADAPEMLQGFAVAIKAGLTKAAFDATVGIHPTAAEEVVTLRTPVTE